MRGKGITIQRRRYYRVNYVIPFSFSVIDAAEPNLIGEKFSKAKTNNIRVAGLRFETSLGLRAGDKLEMNLRLPSSQSVKAVGWVVRAEAVQNNGQPINSVALKFLQRTENEQIQLLEFLAQACEETTSKPAQKADSKRPQRRLSQPIGP